MAGVAEGEVQPVNKVTNTEQPEVGGRKRVPRRVLHFSDGVVEEYSTDEEEEREKEEERRKREEEQQVVDASQLSWVSWAMYLSWRAAASTLTVLDSVGERLAWWLGITSPKYYYEIQEAKRMLEEEEQRRKLQDAEMAGWGEVKEGEVVSREEQVVRREGEVVRREEQVVAESRH